MNGDGSAAVGLAFEDCTTRLRVQVDARSTACAGCDKTSEGAARANAVSGDGKVIGGWEEFRKWAASASARIWEGREQMLLTDPDPQNPVRLRRAK